MATIPASDNVFPILRMSESAAPATPPTGEAHLYVKSDGLLYWKDDAGTEYAVDSGAGLTAHLADTADAHDASAISIVDSGAYFTGADVEAALQELGAAGGGGGGGAAEDPIADVFGTPTTAYEFDAALSGWTNLGTATAQDADTTVPGHYYVNKAASGGTALTGIYRASPSMPFTVIAKVSDVIAHADNYCRAGSLFVGEATPGKVTAVEIVHNSEWYATHSGYTNPTTFGATVGTDHPLKAFAVPVYLGIVANSSTDVDLWYSFGGRVWRKRTDAHNPSLTVGSFGVYVDPESASYAIAAAFDFIRLWNSAKSFPGA